MTDVPPHSPPPPSRDDKQAPRSTFTRRQVLLFVVFAAVAIGLLYGLLPKLAGLEDTWQRLKEGDAWWLALAFGLELCSFGGYVAPFRGPFARGEVALGWRESYKITMAGLAATRLLAAGGAGGVALTAWALRRAGMSPRRVAARMAAFLVLLYAVFMVVMLLDGIGLRTGLFPGEAPWAVTIAPAAFAAVAIALALAMTLVPHDLDRRAGEAPAPTRGARVLRWLASVPATIGDGVRHAMELVRTKDPR